MTSKYSKVREFCYSISKFQSIAMHFQWSGAKAPAYSSLPQTADGRSQQEDRQLQLLKSRTNLRLFHFLLLVINSAILLFVVQIYTENAWQTAQKAQWSIPNGSQTQTQPNNMLTVSLVPEDVRKLEWNNPTYSGWPSAEANSAWHQLAGREFELWIHLAIKLIN